jgi:D-threonate/D-erythronate kinase
MPLPPRRPASEAGLRRMTDARNDTKTRSFPGNPLLIAIIADDLTGVCDTGAQLASAGLRTIGSVTQGFIPDQIPQVLIMNTQSRGMEPLAASSSVRQAAAQMKRIGPKWFFKKIDTALRGNVKVEILSAMESLEMKTALFVGAIPQAGRTTMGGCQFFKGIPITDSILGKDDLNPNPVPTSRISDLFVGEPGIEVEVIDLEQIRSGRLQIAPVQEGGAKKIFVFDAETDADIDHIVRASMKREPSAFLFVGALGLAGALGRSLVAASSTYTNGQNGLRQDKTDKIRGNRILMVSGSPHPATREQIAHLVRLKIVKVIELEPERFLGHLDQCSAEAEEACRAGLEDPGRVLIHVGPNKPDRAFKGERLVTALGQIVHRILSSNEVDGLVAIGGETAFAVCQAIDIKSIEIYGTISAVAAYGKPVGTLKGVKMLVTKGGSLGEKDILEKIIRFLARPPL